MIEVEHLSKIYNTTPAIQDVDFSVAAGEILGFLGPNGAGKTTTMRILSGYLPATSGTARIAGYDVHEQSMEVRKRIGYLPEIPPLYPEMTVEGFLHFVARIKGISAGERVNRVNLAIQRCNIEEKRKILIRKLSKGFRQRVGIAQAIVHNPPTIILDEPTVGLDPLQIIEVRNLIKSLAGEHTIVLCTHILPEASMTCDRVTIINRGRVVVTNTPDNLMGALTGESGYEMEVEGNVLRVKPILKAISGVKSVEIKPFSERPNRSLLRISMDRNTELGRDLASAIVKNGLGLYEMRRTQPTLEDVFLELTTEEEVLDSPPPFKDRSESDLQDKQEKKNDRDEKKEEEQEEMKDLWADDQ
ncbi:MAG: ABC transporter ATP-binding protein [Cyanobacteria bacterium SBLK]|nr:ABC transporter ATP-binding protein [Cyanobacteria bacterium SBLK]